MTDDVVLKAIEFKRGQLEDERDEILARVAPLNAELDALEQAEKILSNGAAPAPTSPPRRRSGGAPKGVSGSGPKAPAGVNGRQAVYDAVGKAGDWVSAVDLEAVVDTPRKRLLRYLQLLTKDGLLEAEGATTNRRWRVKTSSEPPAAQPDAEPDAEHQPEHQPEPPAPGPGPAARSMEIREEARRQVRSALENHEEDEGWMAPPDIRACLVDVSKKSYQLAVRDLLEDNEIETKGSRVSLRYRVPPKVESRSTGIEEPPAPPPASGPFVLSDLGGKILGVLDNSSVPALTASGLGVKLGVPLIQITPELEALVNHKLLQRGAPGAGPPVYALAAGARRFLK